MLKTILFTVFTFILLSGTAQVQTQLIGDSIYIHNNNSTGELILQNSTDSVNGFLFNKGAGRTEFRHALVKIDDSTYLVGIDTLHIDSNPNGSPALNAWNISGNLGMVAGTNFIGTIDNTELMFKVNNILAGRTGKGSFSNTSFGAQSQPINGTGDFNAAFGSLASANLRSGGKNTDIGYEAGFNNLTGNFNTRVGEGANIWDTSSSYNAVLGTEALNHTSLTKIPGGGFNTALGAFALNKHGIYRANIGLGYYAGNGLTGNNTLFISDSAYHMYFKLDSSASAAPNIIGKDANGFWHLYQIPAGINGGGTVTNIATGYGLLGGPITTTGSIVADTASLHQKFVGFEDSTIYYPYNSNPKGYLTSLNAWSPTGNAGTTSSNFLGTKDNNPLIFKVNNIFSGFISTSPSFSSTAFGNSALNTYSTGALTGNPNTAFGSGALTKVTSGSFNTAVGNSAGGSFTTGYYNTSIGNLSNDWNQTGRNNTSIGEESMGQGGSGVHNHSYNTAIGFAALADNYGNYNIGLGNRAGQNGVGDSTLFVSDSTIHMKFRLDSAGGDALNIIGKDANGYWHVYATPVGVGASGDADSLGGQPADYYASLAATQIALDTKAIDSNVVHLSGNETIAGIKLVPTPLSNDSSKQVVNSEWVKHNYAFLTGANVFTGSNTFKNPVTTIGQASINSELHIVGYGGDDVNHRTSWAVNSTGVDVNMGTYSPRAYFHLDWYGGFNLEHFSKSYVDPSNLGFDQTTFAIGNDPTPGATLDILNNGNHRALPPMRFRYSSSDVLKDTLVSGAVEVYKDSIYYTGLNLRRKRLAFADEIGSGSGSGSGTVTSVATGYGLSGGPVTTTGTINVDSATLHLKFMGLKDSTVYYPYATNPKGYLTSVAVQEDASDLPSRSKLNFNYGVTATDNSASSSSSVDVNLSSVSNSLTTDVSMSTGSTFYDGGTISLAAGTWLITATATVESSNNSAMKITGKIWDGTTVYGASEGSVGSLGGGVKGYVNVSMNSFVTVSSTTPIKASYASTTSGCSLKAATADNNTGTSGKTTSITAVRIK